MLHPFLYRHWMKHIAAVPKGFLRYQVLELLSERALSGSEIMDEIEKRTFGIWRPSPGSIYPLLAWLHDSGYIREVPSGEPGVKRYVLTDKGKQFLEEQRKIREHFTRGCKAFASPLLCTLWLRIPTEDAEKLRESVGYFMRTLFRLCLDLEVKFSKETLNEILKTLNETAQKFEEIDKRLLGEGT
ncbi:MAG: PadR family transcriptional regulator [Candidatus Bathyarchaeia archaeon]